MSNLQISKILIDFFPLLQKLIRDAPPNVGCVIILKLMINMFLLTKPVFISRSQEKIT